jgi:MurNAc alpha-1-phosphate uridylyltransferase
MILAAGRGKRMMPLTQDLPKPLLKVAGKSLLVHHLERLQEQGFRHVVINLDYLGEKIRKAIGDGEQYDLNVVYSDESASGALETAGGIVNALPLLKSDPFLVINGDIYTDYPFSELLKPMQGLARLVMVENPPHNPHGDFKLDAQNSYLQVADSGYTFSGIAIYQKELFMGLPETVRALAPLLREGIAQGKIEGVLYQGQWHDIGTPARLAEIDKSPLSN